jgi:hypothetical protein
MIRLTSIQQALCLKGTIPQLAVIRSIQFMGNGYSPSDGHIIVMQEGDTLTQIKEIGVENHADILDHCEFVESFADADRVVFEVVFQLDDERTVAVIVPDEPWLDSDLRRVLLSASPAPMPMPQIKEVTP